MRSVIAFLTILALYQPVVMGDLYFEAERLELRGGQLHADGPITVRDGESKLSGDALRSVEDPRCPTRSLLIEQLKADLSSGAHVEARFAQLCIATKTLHLSDVELSAPQLRLKAKTATASLTQSSITASQGTFSRCRCQDPPWSVSFANAQVTPEGTWVNWPRLQIGSVPVLIAPVWYAPHGRRRSGFLPPSLAWRTEHGFAMEQPLYWVTGDESDITVSGGFRGVTKAVARAEGRWIGASHHQNTVHLDAIGYDLRGHGTAYERFGPIHLTLQGEVLSAPSNRALFIDLWRERALADTAVMSQVDVRGLTYGVGLSAHLAQSQRSKIESGPVNWLEGRWAWAPNVPWIIPRFNGRAVHGKGLEHDAYQLLDAGGQIRAPFWIGALSVDPYVGGHVGLERQNQSESPHSSHIGTGGEVSISWRRSGAADTHALSVVVDGHWAIPFSQTDSIDPWGRVSELNIQGLSLRSRWHHSNASSEISLRQGVAWHEGYSSLEPLGASASVRTKAGDLRTTTSGDDFIWTEFDLRAENGNRIGVAYVNVSDKKSEPVWGRWRDGSRHGRFHSASMGAHSLSSSVEVVLGDARAEWLAAFDVNGARFVGQSGKIKWSGRCRCWSATVTVQHDGKSDLPDLFVSADLGAP